MNPKEHALIPLDINSELVRQPQHVLRTISEFNRNAFEFFDTVKILTAINEKFFCNKGTITDSIICYGMELEGKPTQKKSNRFDSYFSATAELNETTHSTTLSINTKDLLSERNSVHALQLTTEYEVNSARKIFTIKVEGNLEFKMDRYHHNWNSKAFYLKYTGESRTITLTLDKPPQPERVLRTLWVNFEEILEGFAKQGYIKLPENSPPPTTDNLTQTT